MTFELMKAGELAAWIQAVGSIAAIMAAIWISSRQIQTDRRLRQEEIERNERKACEAFVFLAQLADFRVAAAEDYFDDSQSVEQMPIDVTNLHLSLAAINDFDLARLSAGPWFEKATLFATHFPRCTRKVFEMKLLVERGRVADLVIALFELNELRREMNGSLIALQNLKEDFQPTGAATSWYLRPPRR